MKARIESFAHIICVDGSYNYEMAFNYLNQLSKTITLLNVDEFPEKQNCYIQIGLLYYRFHDYQNVIHYMKIGLTATPTNKADRFVVELNNDIGAAYQRLNLLDSADTYFKRGLKAITYEKETDSLWYGILQGNLSKNLYAKQI